MQIFSKSPLGDLGVNNKTVAFETVSKIIFMDVSITI